MKKACSESLRHVTNAAMPPEHARGHCALDSESQVYLEQAMEKMYVSARAHDRIIIVNRILADLAGKENITDNEVLGASESV